MKSLQNKYNLIKEGKGNKELFIKEARALFPNIVTGALTYNQAIHNLAERGIISEGITGVLSQRADEPNWFKIFNENTESVKATLKDADKSVTEKEIAGYDYEDKKNNNNISTAEILKGYYAEMKDPKNADKTEEELKKIVFKNLEKDPMYYIKDGAFGIKGIGYIEDAPGLGATKEVTGKYKSSGMEPVKLNEAVSKGKIEEGINGLTPSESYDLNMAKSLLNFLNNVKPKGEKYEKWKAEAEQTIADLEAKSGESVEKTNETNSISKTKTESLGEIDMTGIAGSEEEEERRLGARNFETPKKDDTVEVDPSYTHFAIRKADNKIVDGWDYAGLESDEIKHWAKEDLKDNWPDQKPSEFTVLSKAALIRKGVDPTKGISWYRPSSWAETELEEDKVPGSNIKKVGDKWRILSGKTGKMWKAHYDSKEDAEKGLKAYFASQHESKNNMDNKETLSEAKKRAIEKHLKEIEKLGEVAAYEYKANKIQEKIEELKNRLTMTESDDVKDMVDKNAIKEIKKDIALLEKRKKMYEAQKAKAAKRVSGDTVRPQAVGGQEMIDEAEDKQAVKVGDTLTKNGKKGKVTKVTDDMVTVDFGNGDIYGIVKRRIKGTDIIDEAKDKAPVWQEAMKSVLKKKGY